MNKTEITLIGNEGFRIATPSAVIYVDGFYGAIPGVADEPAVRAKAVSKADLILVTHAHWDHFNAREVADAAARTGATLVGPRSVIQAFDGILPPESLVELEPPLVGKTEMAASLKVELPAASVTAFRTFHSRDHNSYLVETAAFRFFHDGDNEDTRRIDTAALGRLDALFIGPWQGSGWVEFIETLAPTRWFLMHLSDDELNQHEAGRFLPDLCDHVPEGLVVLRPGESFVFPRPHLRASARP